MNKDNDKDKSDNNRKNLTEEERIQLIVDEFEETFRELEKDRAAYGKKYLALTEEERVQLYIEESDRVQRIARKLGMKMKPINFKKDKDSK